MSGTKVILTGIGAANPAINFGDPACLFLRIGRHDAGPDYAAVIPELLIGRIRVEVVAPNAERKDEVIVIMGAETARSIKNASYSPVRLIDQRDFPRAVGVLGVMRPYGD